MAERDCTCGHAEADHETVEYRGDKLRRCLKRHAEPCGCKGFRPQAVVDDALRARMRERLTDDVLNRAWFAAIEKPDYAEDRKSSNEAMREVLLDHLVPALAEGPSNQKQVSARSHIQGDICATDDETPRTNLPVRTAGSTPRASADGADSASAEPAPRATTSRTTTSRGNERTSDLASLAEDREALAARLAEVEAERDELRRIHTNPLRERDAWFRRMKVAENESDDLLAELKSVRAKAVELVNAEEGRAEAAEAKLAEVERERDDWRLSFEASNEHVGQLEREKAQAEARVQTERQAGRAEIYQVFDRWRRTLPNDRFTHAEGMRFEQLYQACGEALKADAPPAAPRCETHTVMGSQGVCARCGRLVRCCNLKPGQDACSLPNVHCGHPRCLIVAPVAPEPSQEPGR